MHRPKQRIFGHQAQIGYQEFISMNHAQFHPHRKVRRFVLMSSILTNDQQQPSTSDFLAVFRPLQYGSRLTPETGMLNVSPIVSASVCRAQKAWQIP
jgi:hypothetical protein